MFVKESIGATPCDEDCVQVGAENYSILAREEIRRFRTGMEKKFPPPEGASYCTISNHHDFGTYHELGALFDEENEVHNDWFYVAQEGVGTWAELES